jgi:hypothetical protein
MTDQIHATPQWLDLIFRLRGFFSRHPKTPKKKHPVNAKPQKRSKKFRSFSDFSILTTPQQRPQRRFCD